MLALPPIVCEDELPLAFLYYFSNFLQLFASVSPSRETGSLRGQPEPFCELGRNVSVGDRPSGC